ncbi:hypothetical protein SUGI_0142690 [Cryptomeria japonica]|nr:hypothetical protein SUGI_0142690 [Cryptomeria japonica]
MIDDMVLTGDEMSQIDDITLSTIEFGLQGYTGTPSIEGGGNIHTYFINGEPSSLHRRSISGSGNSDNFYIDGEPSSVHWRSISGTNPFAVQP